MSALAASPPPPGTTAWARPRACSARARSGRASGARCPHFRVSAFPGKIRTRRSAHLLHFLRSESDICTENEQRARSSPPGSTHRSQPSPARTSPPTHPIQRPQTPAHAPHPPTPDTSPRTPPEPTQPHPPHPPNRRGKKIKKIKGASAKRKKSSGARTILRNGLVTFAHF